jgi:NADH-quinone oxidoreductase subunit E
MENGWWLGMLTEEERTEIAAELAVAERPRGAAADALKIVQRHRGWVSDEALSNVAELLGMSPAELDSVATFYCGIYRRPVGRHVILLCDSVSCWVMGYNPIRAHLVKRLAIDLGETTADNRFTLLPCACLGVCEQAPAMMIDEHVHGNLTPETIDAILTGYP